MINRNPLRRPDRYFNYLAQADDGTVLLAKIDRDATSLEDTEFYLGVGWHMARMQHILGVESLGNGNSLLIARQVNGDVFNHISVNMTAPFRPSQNARGLRAAIDRFFYRFVLKSYIRDINAKPSRRHIFHRLDPDNYQIFQEPGSMMVITPRHDETADMPSGE